MSSASDLKAKLKAAGKDSARGSEASDSEEEKQVAVQEPEKEEKSDIKSCVLGSADCPVGPDETEAYYQEVYRIRKIENLEACTALQILSLRKNLVGKIEGLDACVNLEELDLYDNRLKKIEGLDSLAALKSLDISFNRIKEL